MFIIREIHLFLGFFMIVFAESKHISEAEFTVSITVANLALSRDVASLTCYIKINQSLLIVLRFVVFVKIIKSGLSENEISFIGIIFDRSSKNDIAQFQLCDRGTLNERSLIFVFV